MATGGADKEGFTANGSWVWGRDPSRAALELLPIGCLQPRPDATPPVPTAALSANYIRPGGARAYATVFEFSHAREARAYVEAFERIESSCGAPPADADTTDGSTYTEQVRLDARTATMTDVRFTSGLVMSQRLQAVGKRVTFTAVPAA